MTKAPNNNMREISIRLPDELLEYLDSNPYIGDIGERSEFIVMLIKRWQREVEKSKREIEGYALQKCGISSDVIPSPRMIGKLCSLCGCSSQARMLPAPVKVADY